MWNIGIKRVKERALLICPQGIFKSVIKLDKWDEN